MRLSTSLFLLPAFLLVGCATTTITNLSSTVQPRNPNNLYPVEMKLDTVQQSLRQDTVTPYAVVGFEQYKLRPVLKMQNRFEGLVPVPPDKDSIHYKFKVDYQYNSFGKPGQASLLSDDYKLTIVSTNAPNQ